MLLVGRKPSETAFAVKSYSSSLKALCDNRTDLLADDLLSDREFLSPDGMVAVEQGLGRQNLAGCALSRDGVEQTALSL